MDVKNVQLQTTNPWEVFQLYLAECLIASCQVRRRIQLQQKAFYLRRRQTNPRCESTRKQETGRGQVICEQKPSGNPKNRNEETEQYREPGNQNTEQRLGKDRQLNTEHYLALNTEMQGFKYTN